VSDHEVRDIATPGIGSEDVAPSAGGPGRGPEAPPRPDGTPGLPLDAALVDGRFPDRGAERVPELHEVGCPPELRQRVEELMSRYPDRHSASIPALWAVQRLYGWCTPDGIRQAAAVMRVTPAYLESVASFYDLLHTEPAGTQRVLVCTNISCWMRGGDELLEAFCDAGGCDSAAAGHGGSVSADGDVYVSGFECLGACDLAPMASINERYFGPLENAEAATAIEQLRSGEEVLPEKALEKRPLPGGPDGEPDPRVTAGRSAGNPPPADAEASEEGIQ
jgi:NADH:ubiquinone oxidoreductase subunit E